MGLVGQSYLPQVGHRMQEEVPGLTYTYGRDADYGYGRLVLKYKCPCGEISCLGMMEMGYLIPDIQTLVNDLKEKLRQHVRSEGNEPNF